MNARPVKCPSCRKPSLFTPENPYRPFCSERCKTIDLGAWAEGKYAIPSKPLSEADLAADMVDDQQNPDTAESDDEESSQKLLY